MKTLLLFISLLVCLNEVRAEPKPFSQIRRYTVSGIISLPYAEISEPFQGKIILAM